MRHMIPFVVGVVTGTVVGVTVSLILRGRPALLAGAISVAIALPVQLAVSFALFAAGL